MQTTSTVQWENALGFAQPIALGNIVNINYARSVAISCLINTGMGRTLTVQWEDALGFAQPIALGNIVNINYARSVAISCLIHTGMGRTLTVQWEDALGFAQPIALGNIVSVDCVRNVVRHFLRPTSFVKLVVTADIVFAETIALIDMTLTTILELNKYQISNWN